MQRSHYSEWHGLCSVRLALCRHSGDKVKGYTEARKKDQRTVFHSLVLNIQNFILGVYRNHLYVGIWSYKAHVTVILKKANNQQTEFHFISTCVTLSIILAHKMKNITHTNKYSATKQKKMKVSELQQVLLFFPVGCNIKMSTVIRHVYTT